MFIGVRPNGFGKPMSSYGDLWVLISYGSSHSNPSMGRACKATKTAQNSSHHVKLLTKGLCFCSANSEWVGAPKIKPDSGNYTSGPPRRISHTGG